VLLPVAGSDRQELFRSAPGIANALSEATHKQIDGNIKRRREKQQVARKGEEAYVLQLNVLDIGNLRDKAAEVAFAQQVWRGLQGGDVLTAEARFAVDTRYKSRNWTVGTGERKIKGRWRSSEERAIPFGALRGGLEVAHPIHTVSME
jgi:hypothetical protein